MTPEETEQVEVALAAVLGEENVLDRPGADGQRGLRRQMGSEGFGALPGAIGVPGVYWFFGGTSKGDPWLR